MVVGGPQQGLRPPGVVFPGAAPRPGPDSDRPYDHRGYWYAAVHLLW